MKVRHFTVGVSVLLLSALLGADKKEEGVYVGGDVQRPGIHPIEGRKATIFTLIDWAGLSKPDADYSVMIIHRVDEKLEVITSYNSLKALKASKLESVPLKAEDHVMFKIVK